jgi:methyl-accepting chemotaxis protein
MLERTVPMIRATSELISEIAAASQQQMAAIREINVGVSQLEEVVQQNAAASHELAATSTDLASQSSSLQQQVEFFRLDPSANGLAAGPPSPPARPIHAKPIIRSQPTSSKKLPAPRPTTNHTPDGQPASLPPGQPAGGSSTAPQTGHGGPPLPPPPSTGNVPPPRGGVVVNLDDDDNFERFS